jgi:hypothetical protein
MTIYMTGLLAGGLEFREQPTRAYENLSDAQSAFEKSFGPELVWEHTMDGWWEADPGSWPHYVVLALDLM